MPAVTADQIVVDLIANVDRYNANFAAATKAANEHTAALKRLAEADKLANEMLRRPSARGARGSDEAREANEAVAAVKRAAREKADAEKTAAREAAEVVKAAEREKAAAARSAAREQALAAREAEKRAAAEKAASEAAVAAAERGAAARARLSAVAQAAIDRRASQIPQADPATRRVGSTVPRAETGQRGIPLGYLNGAATVQDAAPAVEKEVNHLLADRFDLTQKAKVAQGELKRELGDELQYLARIATYKRAGLADDVASLRAETEMTALTKIRAEQQAKSRLGQTLQRGGRFAEAVGLGRTGGSGAAVAGIATAAAIGGGVAIVGEAAKYGKEVQETARQIGLSTHDLQVYQVAAQRAGATNEQLTSAFAHLADQIGRAREGDKTVAKLFSKDNLNIDTSQFRTLADALPTVIDRLSKIEDPVKRSAVGVRLFGEEYRRLDPLLSSGNEKLKQLAVSLGDTILSDSQINQLDDTAKKLGDVNRQLQADLASTVANNAKAITGLAGALSQLTGEVIRFLNSHPQTALTIVGALAGSRVGGLPGAAVGALVGNIAGQKVAEAQSDGNQDLAFRRQEYYASRRNLLALQRANRPSAGLLSINENAAADGGTRTGATVADAEREVARQRGLYQQARATARANAQPEQGAPQGGSPGSLRTAFAPNPPKGPKGKTAEQLDAQEQARLRRYQDQLASLQEQELRAQQQQTGGIERRAGIETQLADRALKKQLADIAATQRENVDKGGNAAVEARRAKELADAATAANTAQKRVIQDDKALALAAVRTESVQTQLRLETESLSVQEQLATTRKERLAIELRLLAKQEQTERASLEGQLAQLKPDDDRRKGIQDQIAALPGKYAQQGQLTRQGSASPLEAYRRQLRATAEDTNDALENIAVSGLGRLEDQVASTTTRILGLKGAFGDLVGSLISDLARLAVEKGFLALFGGGGGLGSLLSIGHGNGSPPVVSLPASGARAAGGPVVGGSTYLVGEHGPELFTASSTGRIVPNNSALAPAGAGGQITIHVQANDYFDARVAHVSGPIAQQASVRVVQAAAPRIASAAIAQTPDAVRQDQLLRG